MPDLFGNQLSEDQGELFKADSSHAGEPVTFEPLPPAPAPNVPEKGQPQAAQWPRPWYYQTPQQRRQDARIARQYRPDQTPGMF